MKHTHKMVNGRRVALTDKEIAAFDARDAAWKADEPNRLAAANPTAEQKLAQLGLTRADLNTLLK